MKTYLPHGYGRWVFTSARYPQFTGVVRQIIGGRTWSLALVTRIVRSGVTTVKEKDDG